MLVLTYSYEALDELFQGNEEGQDQVPTAKAIAVVREHHPEGEISWHLPDVFAVRYGSCYVATATVEGKFPIRFISAMGYILDGDDK
jgi:hypothetical protein